MKKSLAFLVVPASLALFSCGKKDAKKGSSNNNNHGGIVIDDVDVDDQKEHASSVSAQPRTSFYLKVGEEKTLTAKLDKSPTDPNEKKFTWSTSYNNVSVTKNSNETTATVKGISPGNATVIAQNDYSALLKCYFHPNVIDFDEENNYLWQYVSDDRKQFGLDGENPQGTLSGTAVLEGKEWNYTRSNTSSLRTDCEALQLGKGKEPEEHILLETSNNRLVEKIVLQASSANSLANVVVKVGDTEFINEKCPKANNDEVATLTSKESASGAEGDISIEFTTPPYEAEKTSDPSYRAPGAVILKSIFIYYVKENASQIEIAPESQHKVDYFSNDIPTEEGLMINKVSARGTRIPLNVEKELEANRLKIIYPNFDQPSHDAQNVTVKYTPEGSEQELVTTFPIHIRDEQWVPTLSVVGTLGAQALIAGDDMDYSGLQIKAAFDEADDYILYPFSDDGIFDITCYDSAFQQYDPFIAEKAMENGFRVLIQRGDKDTWRYVYTVSGVGLTIQDAIYDRIELKKLISELKLNSTAKAISYTSPSGRITINFDALAKEKYYDNNIEKEVPVTSKQFVITINDKTLCMDKLNVTFVKQSSVLNNFNLSESFVGGTLFGDPVAEISNFKINYNSFEEYTNAVKLAPGLTSTGNVSTNKIGVGSLLIRYVEHKHAEYTLSCGETQPTKVDYNEGDVFDPTGLTVNLMCDFKNTCTDVTQYMKWYDGSTFESKPQETLMPSSTGVVGVFNGKTINVNINSVQELKISISLVRSLDEITDNGHYYLVNRSANLMNLGSATKFTDGITAGTPASVVFSDVTFGETSELNILYLNDYFNIIKESGKDTYVINGTNNHGWSVSASGNVSSTLEPKDGYRSFEITIDSDTGIAKFHMKGTTGTGNEVDWYLGASDKKFDLYAESSAFIGNISIYKVN